MKKEGVTGRETLKQPTEYKKCNLVIAEKHKGAKRNWEIQMTNFPEAVGILDFYHAGEHLADYCRLMKDPMKGQRRYDR